MKIEIYSVRKSVFNIIKIHLKDTVLGWASCRVCGTARCTFVYKNVVSASKVGPGSNSQTQ